MLESSSLVFEIYGISLVAHIHCVGPKLRPGRPQIEVMLEMLQCGIAQSWHLQISPILGLQQTPRLSTITPHIADEPMLEIKNHLQPQSHTHSQN